MWKVYQGFLKPTALFVKRKTVKLKTDDLKDCLVAAVQHCGDDKEVECVADVEMKERDWVVVVYDGKWYPGQLTKVTCDESMKMNVMRPCFGTGWKRPVSKDKIFYKKESIGKTILHFQLMLEGVDNSLTAS